MQFQVIDATSPFLWTDINTLKQRQYCHRFADDIFKCIFMNENVWILIKISMKFVPKVPLKNIPALVQRCPGDKPLSEPMMVSLLTHICITRPQWVKRTHFECRAWLWNHIAIRLWDVITYQWCNFKSCWTQILKLGMDKNYISQKPMDAFTHPCPNHSCRKISDIRQTKSQNLNVYPLALKLSLPNLLKPCAKLRMKM